MIRDTLGKNDFTPIQRNNRIENINNSNKLTLDNLTDEQKSLLTKLSYLDIDISKFVKLQQNNKEITISDLGSLLKSPDKSYLGDLNISDLTQNITGVDISSSDLLKELENAGLGNLKIVDIADNSKSGFQAMCFSDEFSNKGFSFRGTDIKDFSSLTKDSLTDVQSFLTGTTPQLNEAMEFFDKYSNNSESNYLYGHSLGGFLSENVFAKNHRMVANTFVINPLHVDSERLQSDGVINAFNNAEKFSCYVTGGDYVSQINQPSKFDKNINYVKNNEDNKNNIIGNHLIESASFDESGTFITTSKEEAFKNYSPEISSKILGLLNNNSLKKGIDLGQNTIGKSFNVGNNIREKAKSLLNNIFKPKSSNKLISAPPINHTISNENTQPSASQLFRNSLNLKNWISASYSIEDYNAAMEISQNPTKNIQPLSVSNPNRDEMSTERVPWENLQRI